MLLLAGAGALGCSAAPSANSDGGGIFVAFASDFNGFHNWPNSAPATPSPDLPPVDAGGLAADGGTGDGGVHPLPETEYWNRSPPPGSTAFPVGTIIVKETQEADPTKRQVFAMVKRGGDFNASGAVNWEFYELVNNANGSVTVSWQGYGPTNPSMDLYGGNPNVCNDCHKKAAANDYIWSAALQLQNF
ncbi:MAG TPA: hypothetical protein VHO67_06380 [Polyangia bacterium]|nr:hypothetical protein [Polyangia bacterium]